MKKSELKYTIWSDDYDQIESIENDMRDCAKAEPDIYDYLLNSDGTIDEDEISRTAYDINTEYLNDEETNLDIKVRSGIIAIANLGLWNGRRMAYRDIGFNINECLDPMCDYNTFYLDYNGDFHYEGIHHDGTNYVTFRAWRDGLSEAQKATFREKLYHGTATKKDITRYTRRLGEEIAAVYGWKIRNYTKNNDAVSTKVAA